MILQNTAYLFTTQHDIQLCHGSGG